MWKTYQVTSLLIGVSVLSVILTIYGMKVLNNAITAKATEISGVKTQSSTTATTTNPIQLMSALSSKNIRPDDKSQPSIPPLKPSTESQDDVADIPPKGAGSRWTPLR